MEQAATLEDVRLEVLELSDVPWLVVALLYGAGPRLVECLELRVKDLDIGGGRIVVRSGRVARTAARRCR